MLKKIVKNKIIVTAILLIVMFLFIFLNTMQVVHKSTTWNHMFQVMADPTKPANEFIGFDPGEAKAISRWIWIIIATIVGATGMVLAGLITQSLTRNPLADASTLGITQAAIFGVVIALNYNFFTYYVRFSFALIGGFVSALILLLIISISKGKASVSKVVLAGLAIGIVFKTLSFLVRTGDKSLNSISYRYILGGAETIINNMKYHWKTLYISSGLIGLALIITFIIAKSMTLFELGHDNAKNLGVKVKTTKVLSLLVITLTVPASVMIIGNIAFIGLFAVHISRYIFNSRNYRMILLPSIFVSIIMASAGLYLTQIIPSINSGLWMTFIGAPYLIYAGIRGLK